MRSWSLALMPLLLGLAGCVEYADPLGSDPDDLRWSAAGVSRGGSGGCDVRGEACISDGSKMPTHQCEPGTAERLVCVFRGNLGLSAHGFLLGVRMEGEVITEGGRKTISCVASTSGGKCDDVTPVERVLTFTGPGTQEFTWSIEGTAQDHLGNGLLPPTTASTTYSAHLTVVRGP